MVTIKNLNFSYKNKEIFNNLNMEIKQGEFVFIIGKSGVGKTTLIRILSGLIKEKFDIQIDNKKLEEMSEIRKIMNISFEGMNSIFLTDTVQEELELKLKNLNISKEEIKKQIKEITKHFEIEHILECDPNTISGGEKELVKIVATLLGNPKIIILDECTAMLDGMTKEKLFKYLKKINRQNKTTIICTTNDIDDILYGKRIIMLGNENIVLDSKLNKALGNEKIFKENNLELPFMASLSTKLKYYNLLDEIILDMNKMVNKIWK